MFSLKKKKVHIYVVYTLFLSFSSFFSISSWQCCLSPFLFAFFFAECLSSFLDHLDSFLSNVGKLKGEVGQYIGASTCK